MHHGRYNEKRLIFVDKINTLIKNNIVIKINVNGVCLFYVFIRMWKQCLMLSVSVYPQTDISLQAELGFFFPLWSFSRSLQLLYCFTSFHSIDEAFTVMAAGAGHLPKRVRASILPHSCPLTRHAGIHPLSMHALLMHSSLFSYTGSITVERRLLHSAGKQTELHEVNQAANSHFHAWLSNHSLHCFSLSLLYI